MFRDRRTVFMYLHIPKCLGTTLTDAIGSSIRRSAHVYEAGRTKSDIMQLVYDRARERRVSVRRLRVIHGHSVFEGLHSITGRSPRYLTFLRDPVKRQLSLYNYYRTIAEQKNHPNSELFTEHVHQDGRIVDFPDWIELHLGQTNIMSRTLAYASMDWKEDYFPNFNSDFVDAAKQFLKRMEFVGFVESAAEDVRLVCQMLKMPPPQRSLNISKKFFRLQENSPLCQRIRDLNSCDQEIFEFGHQLRQDRSMVA